jgi:TadE-like protein
LVEAALVSPFLFLLLFGIIEFAWVLKDRMSVQNATTETGREISASANDAVADFNGLQQARKTLSALGKRVDLIVVFKATARRGAGAVVPSSCTTASAIATGGVLGLCNVYDPSDFGALESAFGYSSISPNPLLIDRFYPARDRSVTRSNPENIGVYIKMTYEPITGIIQGPIALSSTTVIPIEPRQA